MSDKQSGFWRRRRESWAARSDSGERVMSRSLEAELQPLLRRLHDEGMTWLSIGDLAANLGAVTAWQSGHLAGLIELCAAAGWPAPASGGKDFTTPAALAVARAKERLAEAMLADHHEGESANTIAVRASNAYSRPVALKVLAGMRLLDDAVTALSPLMEAGIPVYLWPRKDRSVRMTASWRDEDETTRRRQLRDIDKALKRAGLFLQDPTTHVACTAEALATDEHSDLEIVRTAR